MNKYCSMPGCDEKVIWQATDIYLNLIGICPKHGHVAGTFLFHPLSFIDKVILKIKGYRFKEK